MRLRRLAKLSKASSLLFSLLGVVLWNEFLSLKFSMLSWTMPEVNSNSFPILIVSDPQLIGYRHESPFFGPISRWDADRYIRRGFQEALAVVKPKLIIFLGDLFDEGVDMNSEEFEFTMERFRYIFDNTQNINKFYIPGDNDIGGEMEPVYDHLVNRFRRHFANAILTGDLPSNEQFFEVSECNMLTDFSIRHINEPQSSNIKILLSHVPISRSVNPKVQAALENYNPDLILSGHDHTAEIYIRDRFGSNSQRFLMKKTLTFVVNSEHPFTEIQNPTCSYRMGVKYMGYGVLTLHDENPTRVQFNVFWTPGRYPQLFLYMFSIFLASYIFLRSKLFYHLRTPDRNGFGSLFNKKQLIE